ncbi:MAG: aspartate 1-decarboxylase [Bacilli bacterium]
MLVQVLKSKILRAVATDARIDYEGSLAIDEDLMDKVGMLCYEKILVGNITNGERFETYAIPAPAAARHSRYAEQPRIWGMRETFCNNVVRHS